MKYAIIKNINGNFFVHAEGFTALDTAKTEFHTLCATLWNAPDVESACVMIVNSQLEIVEGYKEYIHYGAQPAPDPPAE